MRNGPNVCNMVSKIKNGLMAKRCFIIHPKKKICELILKVLWDEGYILKYIVINEYKFPQLKIFLKYRNSLPVIKNIYPVSLPSNKIYYSTKQLWKIDSSKSFMILTTNQGVKTLEECKRLNVGGKALIVIQ